MIRTLLVASLASPLLAQLPVPPVCPPTTGSFDVGQRHEQEANVVPGPQRIRAYCSYADYRPDGVGFGGVGLGGAIYWESWAERPWGGYYAPYWAPAMAFFALAPSDAAYSVMLPNAAPGFDQIMVWLDYAVFVAPTHHYVETFGGTRSVWVVQVPVPNDPALVGTTWDAQAFRIDPTDGMVYLSDAVAVEVRP